MRDVAEATRRIMVVGSTNVDLFSRVPHHPVPGETVLGGGGQRAPGGKGANQALAARLQGADVSFVGAVGSDSDAEVALARLRQAGADLSAVRVVPETPTGLAIITVADGGENTIVVVPGANACVTPADAEDALASSSLSSGDVLLMQGELPRETTEAAIRYADAGGIRAVLNLAPWGELEPEVLRMVDPLVVNEHEAAAVAAALGVGSAEAPDELAKGLVSAGMRSVVLTLGARGAVVADRSALEATPSPTVPAVDTTGAGDAFTGGLLARLAAGDGLAAAAAHATRVGAYSVRYPGAQPSYPSSTDTLP